jgi:hypothetical protein
LRWEKSQTPTSTSAQRKTGAQLLYRSTRVGGCRLLGGKALSRKKRLVSGVRLYGEKMLEMPELKGGCGE